MPSWRRSAAYRIAFANFGVFAIGLLLLGIIVFFAMHVAFTAQLDATISDESQTLIDEYRAAGGERELGEAIAAREHSTSPTRLLYAVFAPDACWALRRSQPHPGIEDHTAPPCPHLVEAGVTAAHTLCLPLNAQGTAFGVLTLCATAPLAPATQQLAATAADQLALALGNLQLQASLRTQSIRDPLTGLFNRRYLEASMPRELLRAERRQGALSVLAFDIDHFKRYNDTQGHDAGDALLGAFGALLAQSCRDEDIPCHYGGEEFTLILTEANHSQALARAEAIRKATSELVVHYRAGTLPPATVSIGVASHPEHGNAPDTLLRLADQALYRAKHLGRNTIASANDLESVVNAPVFVAHP